MSLSQKARGFFWGPSTSRRLSFSNRSPLLYVKSTGQHWFSDKLDLFQLQTVNGKEGFQLCVRFFSTHCSEAKLLQRKASQNFPDFLGRQICCQKSQPELWPTICFVNKGLWENSSAHLFMYFVILCLCKMAELQHKILKYLPSAFDIEHLCQSWLRLSPGALETYNGTGTDLKKEAYKCTMLYSTLPLFNTQC